jgi:hypothetical protein
LAGYAQSPSQEEQSGGQDQHERLVHGIRVGGGLAAYQGDISRNPNDNILKYVGTAKPSILVGADYRTGYYDQFGVGLDLVYTRLGGETTGNTSFSNNMVSLDAYADYELPYIQQGLFRIFLGGGASFLVSPSYQGFETGEEWRSNLGTRVVGSFSVGVTIIDKIQVGARFPTTDYLDGYGGLYEDPYPDVVSFVRFTHRFELRW